MKGFTIWFTGFPCSGKTTLSTRLYNYFLQNNIHNVELLDGDIVRNHLTKGLGFTKEGRDENIRRIGWLCHILNKHGVNTIVAVISPYRNVREEQRKLIKNFFEIYVKCPVEICEKRDVKGMFKKAREGTIKNFTGVDDPYEPPLNPELILETDKESVEESSKKIIDALLQKGILKEKSCLD